MPAYDMANYNTSEFKSGLRIIIDGNPLENMAELANVEVVIQGGRVVVDNR